MANPNQPPDPPPTLSATELRKRLLASAPPPVSSPSSVEMEGLAPAPSPGGLSGIAARGADVLSRLRLPPTQSGAIPNLTPAPEAEVAPSPPPPAATINSRRAPVLGTRFLGDVAEQTGPPRGASVADGASAEVQRLKHENKELRQLLDEMKHLLQEASDTEQQYASREVEFQSALTDRQRQVDELSAQIQAIEEQIASGQLGPTQPHGPPKTRTELEEWADELEKESAKISQERKKLEHDRQQLRDDEEALETQMREMELSMARERALLARQETQVKTLLNEIQHDLELMQRGDASLREQMQKFQRRAADVMKVAGPQGPANPPPRR